MSSCKVFIEGDGKMIQEFFVPVAEKHLWSLPCRTVLPSLWSQHQLEPGATSEQSVKWLIVKRLQFATGLWPSPLGSFRHLQFIKRLQVSFLYNMTFFSSYNL